ncbi:MAG: tRNA lysidine(34) synthetase TilS, partial [Clostridiales bacterium]|nr:tRNA lysidine(34) synthetase TilS [Clostridiales bacterium]
VVLGLSGGPDSVCLLHNLLIPDVRPAGALVCAHVNHGLRGAESDADAAFVTALCARLGLPLEILRIDAAALAAETGMGLEEAGRAARYAFFDEAAEKYMAPGMPPPVIAVAHNQNDQVETVLMRLLRGTGTDGLAGMPYSRKSAAGYDVIRPLLDVSRAAIEDWLAARGLDFRRDASNDSREPFRNRIRHEALPALEAASGACVCRSVLRLAGSAAEDRDYFDAACAELMDACETAGTDILSYPLLGLAELHPALRHRLVVKLFARLGLARDIAQVHLAAADRLLGKAAYGGGAGGKRVEFPDDYTLGVEGPNAVFRAPNAARTEWKPRRTAG